MSNEEKVKTGNFIYGAWITREDEMNDASWIYITITREEITIIIKEDGVQKEPIKFDTSPWWVEQYLCFTNPSYYVTKANENEMIFGELVTPGVFNGNPKWVKEFKRVE